MDRILNYILGTVVVALLLYVAFGGGKKEVLNPSRELDSLKFVIEDLKEKQKTADSTIAIYIDSVAKLDVEIQEKKKQILKVRKEYENKINNISKLTPTQLSKFFTDRYK